MLSKVFTLSVFLLGAPSALAQSTDAQADRLSDAGVEALIENRALEAARSFQAALEVNPEHPQALNGLGVAQLQLGDVEQATEQFLAALEANPSSTTPLMNLADLALIQNEAAAALNYYALVLDIDAGNPEATTKLSRLHRMAGVPNEGLALVESALTMHPKNVDLLVEAGACRMLLEAPGRALETLIQAYTLDPDHPEALLWSGRAFSHTEQWALAEKNLERLTQLQPSATAHLELARVYAWSSHSAAQAIEQARQAAALDPDLADAQALLGTLLMQQQDLNGSVTALERAVAVDWGHCPARVALAKISVQRGLLDTAQLHLQHCIDATWDFEEARVAKVFVDSQAGDCEAAREGVEWLKTHKSEHLSEARSAAKRCK